MTKKTTYAVLYLRFSPRPKGSECMSNIIQEELCRAYCKSKGYEVVAVYEDSNLSGADENRPGLWSAIESLKKGYILVVHKLDRLVRSVYLAHIIEHEVEKRKATFESSIGEGTWTFSPEEEMIRNILFVLADYQRKAGAARTSAMMLAHQRGGRRMCRKDLIPYGRKLDPEDDSRMIDSPKEQKTIKSILSMRNNDGVSYRYIARSLNDMGIPCRGTKGWYPMTVRSVVLRAEG